jgi:signal transduction histidine kinase/CheY-like chemotaxis protein
MAAIAGQPEGTPENLTLRFDIVISRLEMIQGTRFAIRFQQDPDLAEKTGKVAETINSLTPLFDQIQKSEGLPPGIIAPIASKLNDLRTLTERLLTSTNARQLDTLADERKATTRSYRILTGGVITMAITLCTMVVILARQLRAIERTNRDLRELSENYHQAAIAADAGNRAKTIFLATMSHEIRTPLNGIIGGVELLKLSNCLPEQQAMIKCIDDCGNSLLQLIGDVLDYSKLNSESIELERREFDLGELIESAVSVVTARAQAKNLGLIAFSPEATLMGDETRLRQILVNLCGNAIKFTEKGDACVVVRRVESDAEIPKLRFEVSDTGVGIPKEAESRLFKEFNQVDSSINRKFGGSGLGLAICRKLVEIMGGEIGVESTPGEGSCFWFTLRISPGVVTPIPPLPYSGSMRVVAASTLAFNVLREQLGLRGITVLGENEQGPEPTLLLIDARRAGEINPRQIAVGSTFVFGIRAGEFSHLEPEVIEGPLTLRRLRKSLLERGTARQAIAATGLQIGLEGHLLVAEDNRVNQLMISGLLKSLGLTAEIVENGERAIEAVKARKFDLVLMDMQMPVLDGLEATRRIRQLGGHAATMPIVGLTANAFASDRILCLTAGMSGYLSKPINRAKLEATLQDWLPKPANKNAGTPALPRTDS